MARQNLSGMTPEERADHKRKQAADRKRNQRKKQKEEREMARMRATLTSSSPEVIEFVNEIDDLPFRAKVELIAEWEREFKQKLPVKMFEPIPGEPSENYWSRKNRIRDLELAKMLASGHLERKKASARKKAFNDSEAEKAAQLGLTVYEYQKRKKVAAWKDKKQAEQKTREVGRLARREAA
ncbi:hypothetical protein F9K94_00965 [Brucella tritici]|uniref:Uncharacterized protein n=1 Tax=Brucella tritici TaxID=94626 RepID=A0A7V7VXA0_9HYPH|nr:hypothetical protein [Brucella tritici]KAB2658802.1 hypothetical protein F9K94_00965 [Brucella tritici]